MIGFGAYVVGDLAAYEMCEGISEKCEDDDDDSEEKEDETSSIGVVPTFFFGEGVVFLDVEEGVDDFSQEVGEGWVDESQEDGDEDAYNEGYLMTVQVPKYSFEDSPVVFLNQGLIVFLFLLLLLLQLSKGSLSFSPHLHLQSIPLPAFLQLLLVSAFSLPILELFFLFVFFVVSVPL